MVIQQYDKRMTVQYFTTSDHIRLAFQLDGENLFSVANSPTPLLLLNGLFGDMPFWDSFVEAFAGERLCIRCDHRGVGLSQRGAGPYSYERYAQDVVELLDLLKVDRVHLVGLCHGGMVGAILARDFAERLQSLTLQGSRLLYSAKIRLYDLQRKEALLRDGVVEMTWRQTPLIFSEKFLQESEPWLRRMAENALQRMDAESGVGMLDALADFALDDRTLQGMRVPALFLCGSEDLYSPPWLVKKGADLWPGARFVEVPGSAHIMTREAPEVFLEEVRRFMAANS